MSVGIPARCVDRPVVGGLVVPAVSVVLADGRPVLGAVHRSKALACITGYRCQIDGQPLTRPFVVLVPDSQLADCYSAEAALHPECAAYSTGACPALNGRRDTIRSVDQHLGSACSDPGCGCGGWVDSDPQRVSQRGRELGPWSAVWLDGYAIAVNTAGEIHGLSWRDETPRRIRSVPGTQPTREEGAQRA